ncbi:DUF58 domain-containing protein [Nakamurella lactea]|uniref:DUF58 domain-containing protein n=1 Tax=Nakamurella lactea TaxID=459515 RepID=UPI00042519A2|nr:DUF58 domain-containing protein [Nakamurella lactea]
MTAPNPASNPLPNPARAGRRVGLTGRGLALAIVAGCCLLMGALARYPGLLGLGIAAGVSVGVSMIGLVTQRGLTVTRTLPDRPIRRLTVLSGRMSITPRASAPGGEVEVTERVAGRPLTPQRMSLDHQGSVLDYPISTDLPGPVQIGPAQLRFFGFAGLARMRLTDATQDLVMVLARSLPMRMPENGLLPVEALRSDEVEGGGTELRSLRPYAPGDDLRKVNARISARVGRLMIRQDAEPSVSSVNVVVDNVSGTEPETYAEMLDVATSVVGFAVRSGLPVTWTGRGRDGVDSADADGLTATELAIACLPLTDDSSPRVPGGDLTVVVCGPQGEPGELAHRLGGGHDHRMMVILQLDGGGGSDEAGGDASAPRAEATRGVLVLRAATAEMVLRRLSGIDSNLTGAAR